MVKCLFLASSRLWLLLLQLLTSTNVLSSLPQGVDMQRADGTIHPRHFDLLLPNLELEYTSHPFDRRLDNTQTLQYPDDFNTHNPIRIRFLTTPLESRRGESDLIDAEIDNIIDRVLPQVAETWTKFLSVVPVAGNISISSNACFNSIDNLQDATFDDADLVVLVTGSDYLPTAGEICHSNTLAAAFPCALDQYDRPVIGLINFCIGREQSPTSIRVYLQQHFEDYVGTDLRLSDLRGKLTEIATHETMHILAFNEVLFKYFRDSNGEPIVSRPFVTDVINCIDGSTLNDTFPTGVVELMEFNGHSSYAIITPTVLQVARNQFDCQSMAGVRLEDTGDVCIGSHWHERFFYGELMGPSYTVSSQNLLSPISLAILEDSGWYKVDYRNADTMSFGVGAGCNFLTEDCIQNEQVPTFGEGAFCNVPLELESGQPTSNSLNHVMCDPSYRSFTICDLVNRDQFTFTYDNSTPRYFSDASLSPIFQGADGCPVQDLGIGLDCTREQSYTPRYGGEDVGSDSRCIPAYSIGSSSETIYRPACMKVTCDVENATVILGSGQYEQVCEYDGQELSIPNSSGAKLICPRLAALCPDIYSCPGLCSGKGVCVFNSTTPTATACSCFDSNITNVGCYEVTSNGNANTPSGPTISPRPTSPTAVPTAMPSIDIFSIGPNNVDSSARISSLSSLALSLSLAICLSFLGTVLAM